MKYFRHLFLTVCILGLSYSLAFCQWVESPIPKAGMAGSGTYAAKSHHDGETIILSSDMGHVLKTQTSGDDWELIHHSQLKSFLFSPVQFTSDPNKLYAIDNRADAFKPAHSFDGGQSWSQLDNDPAEGKAIFIRADPMSTERLLIANERHLFFSANGGEHFSLVHASPDANLHAGGAFWDGENIYIGTNEGILFSSNNGQDFSPLANVNPPEEMSLLSFTGARSADGLRFFALYRPRASVYPRITGASYEQEHLLLCISINDDGLVAIECETEIAGYPFFVGMARNNTDIAYLAGATLEKRVAVWKTTDAGASWNNTLDIAFNNNITTGFCGDGSPYHWPWAETALGFCVNPVDADDIILSDYGFVHRSTNGGADWEALYVHPDDRNEAGQLIDPTKPYRTNGLQVSSVWQYAPTSSGKMFLSMTDMEGFMSEDEEYWRMKLPRTKNTTYYFLEHPESNTWYIAQADRHDMYQTPYILDSRIDGYGGQISYSTDEGETWSLLHDFGMAVIWLAMDPDSSEIMYAAAINSETGGIYKTSNLSAGPDAVWEKLPDPPRTEGHPYTVIALEDGGLVCTNSARRRSLDSLFTASSGVFYSPDGGESWEDRSEPRMQFYTKDIIVDPHDPQQNTWYACVWDGWKNIPTHEYSGLYKTTDRGLSWTRISDLFRVESATIHPDIPSLMFVTTEQDGLYICEDLDSDTPTFRLVEEYPFHHPMRVFFDGEHNNEVWITSFGNGLYRGILGVTNNVDSPETIPFLVYPNPAKSVVTFDLQDTGQSRPLLLVYDAIGRLQFQARLNDQRLELSRKAFGSGVFFYQLRSEEGGLLKQGKFIFQ